MKILESYQLLHPELLDEATLLEVLKDKCVEVPVTKSNDRNELLEIFKRVAMPLPQRSYNGDTKLGRKLIDLRKNREQQNADAPQATQIFSGLKEISRTNGSSPTQDRSVLNRLKPPLLGTETVSKKIKLSRPQMAEKMSCDSEKRKGDENLTQSPPSCKKRQKITWP